eukprot:197374-Pleurochrysis_carterae.AAC.2
MFAQTHAAGGGDSQRKPAYPEARECACASESKSGEECLNFLLLPLAKPQILRRMHLCEDST